MHDVEVRESPVQGRGVFAVSGIPVGELIREYNIVREITSSAPIDPKRGESLYHCTSLDDRVFLVGPPDRYFNHSCDANAYKRFRGTAIEIVARRDIPAGSEITHDYLINTHDGSTWTCSCGSLRCRGTMPRSFFDLPKSIQIEYVPLLAEWFVSRHSERVQELAAEARRPTKPAPV
jgi:SET domain-containing protein